MANRARYDSDWVVSMASVCSPCNLPPCVTPAHFLPGDACRSYMVEVGYIGMHLKGHAYGDLAYGSKELLKAAIQTQHLLPEGKYSQRRRQMRREDFIKSCKDEAFMSGKGDAVKNGGCKASYMQRAKMLRRHCERGGMHISATRVPEKSKDRIRSANSRRTLTRMPALTMRQPIHQASLLPCRKVPSPAPKAVCYVCLAVSPLLWSSILGFRHLL